MSRRLTLVEVLVATGLGVLLVGVAAMVFIQSQDVFQETNTRITASIQMRGALRQVRRDLVHTVNTGDAEFFSDQDGSGHHSAGEELPGQDPLLSPGGSANAPGYTHSMALCRANYTRTSQPVGAQFRSDALYFRVDPGEPNLPYLVEYRLVAAGPRVDFVRRTFKRSSSTAGVVTSTDVLLEDVISLTFEFQDPHGAWVDASAATALGLRTVTASTGSVVEMCFEGTGQINAGERTLRVPNSPGTAALRPGDRIHLYGASSAAQSDFTIEDVMVQGGDAVITFEERMPPAASNGQVSWRVPRLPGSIRVRVIMRKRGSADSTVSTDSVFQVR